MQAQCRPSHSRTARGGKSTGVLGVVQPDPDFGRKTAMRHAAAADSEIDVFDAASGAHFGPRRYVGAFRLLEDAFEHRRKSVTRRGTHSRQERSWSSPGWRLTAMGISTAPARSMGGICVTGSRDARRPARIRTDDLRELRPAPLGARGATDRHRI